MEKNECLGEGVVEWWSEERMFECGVEERWLSGEGRRDGCVIEF